MKLIALLMLLFTQAATPAPGNPVIVIETVKKAEDSDHVIVRMYECHNSRGWAELFCIRPIRAAALCDLEENVVGELDVQDGLAIFDYRPFEIVTVRLEF